MGNGMECNPALSGASRGDELRMAVFAQIEKKRLVKKLKAATSFERRSLPFYGREFSAEKG